jgi:hypothetical protein
MSAQMFRKNHRIRPCKSTTSAKQSKNTSKNMSRSMPGCFGVVFTQIGYFTPIACCTMLEETVGGWNNRKIASGSGTSFADGEALALAPGTGVLVFDG